VFPAQRLQQGQVAGAAVAEAELGADPDFAGGQPLHQHPPHEVIRRHRRHGRVEAQQADHVHAQGAQALELGARQRQPRRCLFAPEEFARQRLEAQRHRRQPGGARTRPHVADQRPMPQVEAVEGADANHAALRAK
jgi:hypothetical protein